MAGIDIRQVKQKQAKEKDAPAGSSISELLNKDIRLFGKSFGDKKKERFYAELNLLLAAGIDIKTALELIEQEQPKAAERQLLNGIRTAVINGSSLSDALQATGRFSAYEFYSIRIGEETGRMAEVLNDLADYFTKKIKQRRKVSGALSYPMVVLGAAVLVVFFMMKFVVPMFADVFKRFKQELPPLTKGIISLSESFSAYSGYFFLAVFGLLIFCYAQRKQSWYRKFSSAFVLRLPYFGKLVQKIYLERFCHAMHLLTVAKTPLVNALELVEKMVGYYPIEMALEKVRDDILHGKSLHESLAQFPVFNRRMVSLLRVAEEVNQLDLIFGKLSKQYTEEIDHETSIIGSVVEPVMIIVLGLLVAVILVAMYLPMFQLSTAFGA
ncbi:MAG: type II secretory pathway, component PulF [Bacteroidetes bacterium]|nr:MAG: type II secretory pathway, component PulF [Bacteroidota bacterium]